MAKIDLSKYGISGTTEIVHNPSYELLFEEETKPELEGFEKGQESELGSCFFQLCRTQIAAHCLKMYISYVAHYFISYIF